MPTLNPHNLDRDHLIKVMKISNIGNYQDDIDLFTTFLR